MIEIKRNKDGTMKGISTMGDFITEEPLTPEQQEIARKKAELEKKYER